MKRPSAGHLTERMTFQKRADLSSASPPGDGYGNVEGGWTDQFTIAARRVYLRGGEDVLASRLEGRQPVILTVRRSSDTETITTDWRATDARSGTIYNIRSVQLTEDRAWIDMLCESGVAT